MPFPPLFASGSTYSNRYDLDKLDVLIDENYRSISESTYFEVIGIPSPLTYGKHYFTISFKPNNNLKFFGDVKTNMLLPINFNDYEYSINYLKKQLTSNHKKKYFKFKRRCIWFNRK